MPAEFHFLRPDMLWLLLPVGLLIVLLARRRLAPGSWQRIISPALAPYVLSDKALPGSDYRWWLMSLAAVLGIISLAGPAFQRIEQPVFRSEQAVVIALDLSRSMDAQDIAPSRLTRARLKILEIISERKSGQTALVVFSSNAFTVTPLTTDTDTVAALVNSLSTDIMPSRGSYPASAIRKAHQLLTQANVAYGEVLLISDGGTSGPAEAAARELRNAGYRLSVLGVGTEEGAPIPRAGGGFVTDQRGNIAVPRLADAPLRKLADEGNGRYARMTTDNSDIEFLMSDKVVSPTGSGASQATDQWREEGPWLLLLLLPIAALAFRRGALICVAILVLPISEPAQALSWDDLWLNRNQQAQKKLQEGEASQAAQLFEDKNWRAVANYQAGDFASSAADFAGGDNADNLYNQGNALAKAGRLESAIAAYDQALELRPEDEDTHYNRQLVQSMLEQQKQQEKENEQSKSDSDGQSKEQGEQGEADSEDQQSSDGDPNGERQEGDSTRDDAETSEEEMKAMQEALERAAAEAQGQEGEPTEAETEAEAEARRMAQEQNQAMEQWLRRVENDPGGLLRRKFKYQYQRGGMDQDGNSVWPDEAAEPW